MFRNILQYGRKDIEYIQKNKIKELTRNECNTEEISKCNKTAIDLKFAIKHNGIKNGVVNGTNQVINRDDNLILVPEPTKKQFTDEKILYKDDKVSS